MSDAVCRQQSQRQATELIEALQRAATLEVEAVTIAEPNIAGVADRNQLLASLSTKVEEQGCELTRLHLMMHQAPDQHEPEEAAAEQWAEPINLEELSCRIVQIEVQRPTGCCLHLTVRDSGRVCAGQACSVVRCCS